MSEHRTQIEQRFPALKAVTKSAHERLQPVLPAELASWVLQITSAIIADVHTFAVPDFSAPMEPVMSIAHAVQTAAH